MNQSQSNLFARDDTFFGVCEALGQDFGFHPNWLRVAIAPLLFLSPVATIAAYFGAGLLILVTRLLYPVPRRASTDGEALAGSEAPQPTDREDAIPVPLAA